MKKQILFRADGGPSTTTVNLLPADLHALNAVNTLVYRSWNRADKGTTFSYQGRQCFKTTFSSPSADAAAAAFAILRSSLGGNVVKGYEYKGSNLHIYASTDSPFLLVRSMVEAMQKLYSLVSSLPQSTSEDQYLTSNGLSVPVHVPNTHTQLLYTVPFDLAAWEQRHRTTAQVATSDAQAKQKQQEANKTEAEAKKEASKAKLMKVGTLAAIVAVLAFVVFLVVKILKK